MSRYYQRPENALKKATEFIEVGKPTRALDTLYDVIKGKKHRSFSEKVIEPIMLKYLELCVELKKPHTAKEGLYQYRLMCQSVNVGLLEKVIRSYIRMAEDKTEAAKAVIEKKAASAESSTDPIVAIVEVDDLDNLSMADMTLLNVITEEQAQERSGRAALIPWVKFLWESYTQCLDLLRNNPRLENLYHDIAQMAFKFCLAYSRKTEFRKLCERLRKHFDDIINRQGSQMNSIDFSSPETQQLNMETRLSQLDSAITLELWQEAYKAIEDIHLLMNQSKKSQTRMMAYYYQKLSLVFWKAGNHLFHAATLMKYYMLCKDMKKNVSAEELQKNASQVVLATLAIPFPVLHPEFERFVETDKGMQEKAQKLATLLFLPQPPTRTSMMRDINRHGILSNAIKPLQDLHELLESEFCPLTLCTEVNELVSKVSASEYPAEIIEQYIEPLREITLFRLIKQVSQVYQTIDYDHLLSLTVFSNVPQLEQILVDAVRYNDMQIIIDHRANCVKFGSSLAEASREDLPEGPHLQIMPSETVRLQLVNVMNCLQETVDMIRPLPISVRNCLFLQRFKAKQNDEDLIRQKIVNHYRQTEQVYHRQLMDRQKIINVRREELERSAFDREIEEKMRSEKIVQQQMALEQKRLETEQAERERKKVEAEQNEMRKRQVQQRINQIGQTALGSRIVQKFLDQEDTSKMDVETLLARQQEELQKEAKEHLARMKAQEKRFDHVERAKRIEEIAVIEQEMTKKKEQEKIEWEQHEAERIAHLIEERAVAVTNRDRMVRMRDDKTKFLQQLLDARRDKFVEKLEEFEKEFQSLKAARLEERKDMRRQERRRRFEEERAAAERARLDAIRRQKEEEERIEREKLEKELEEKNRITLEKQLAKQREIEEREAKDREERLKSKDGAAPASPAAPGVWRPKSIGQKSAASSEVSSPAISSVTASPAPATNAWKPKVLREKIAMESGGDSASASDSAPSPRVRPERHTDSDRDSDFDRGQMRKTDERPFERKGGAGDTDRPRDRDRSDWGRDRDGPRGGDRGGFERRREGDRDRGGFDSPRGGFDSPRSAGTPRDPPRAPDDGSWRRGDAPRGGDGQRDGRGGGRGGRDGRDGPSRDFGGRDRRGGDREPREDAPTGGDDNWRRPGKKEEGGSGRPRSKQ